MASVAGSNEKQKKGPVMYIYKLNIRNLKSPLLEYDPPSTNSFKKAISRGLGIGLRRSKTVREVDHRRINYKFEEGLTTTVKEIVEARKSVSGGEAAPRNSEINDHRRQIIMSNKMEEGEICVKDVIIEARKSISGGEAARNLEIVEGRKSVSGDGRRKSVSHLEVNLALEAAFLHVKVLVTDMPAFMQVHAFRCARRTYDCLEKFSSKHIAYNMKKVIIHPPILNFY